ncbi:MAG: hypothetical protein GF353_09515 [Candidatus Lokiarchaeota archaeon]|nr:hypothetical protein [Candidatus Lokiarchaeota archaeon]
MLCYDDSRPNLFLVSGFEKCSFSQRVMGKKVVTTPASGTIDNRIAFKNALLEMDDPYAAKGTSSLRKFYEGLVKAGEILGIDYIKVSFSNPDLNLLTAGVNNSLEAEIVFSKMPDLGLLFFSLSLSIDLDKEATFVLSDETLMRLTNGIKEPGSEGYISKDDVNQALKQFYDNFKSSTELHKFGSFSDGKKLVKISHALGITPRLTSKIEVHDTLREIHAKIGPFLLKMLLEDRVRFDANGRWSLKGVYFESLEQAADLICGPSLSVGGSSYFLPNDLSRYYGSFTRFMTDLTTGGSHFGIDLRKDHFAQSQHALDELIFAVARRALFKNKEVRVIGQDKDGNDVMDVVVKDDSGKEIVGLGAIQNAYSHLCSELTELPSRFGNKKHLKDALYEWLHKRIGEAQTGTIKEDFEFNAEKYLYYYNRKGDKYSFKISITAKQINEFLNSNGFYGQYHHEKYINRILTQERLLIPEDSRSALQHRSRVANALFNGLQSVHEGKLYFNVYSEVGRKIRDSGAEKLLPYYSAKPDLGNSEGYELDLQKGASATDQINEVNLLKIYASLLAGYSVYISESPTRIGYGKAEMVAILTRTGCKLYERRTINKRATAVNKWSAAEKQLNALVGQIFSSDGPYRTSSQNDRHYLLPYAVPSAFIELLLAELAYPAKGHRTDPQGQANKMVQNFIDLQKLDEIMFDEGNGDWINFKKSFATNDQLRNDEIPTIQEIIDESWNAENLRLFIYSIAKIYFKDSDGERIGLPLPYHWFDLNQYYPLSEYYYEISPVLSDCLYLSRYLDK